MLLPNDITSVAIQNICIQFTKPTAEIIGSQAYHQRMFLRDEDKVESKSLKSNINPMSP